MMLTKNFKLNTQQYIMTLGNHIKAYFSKLEWP